MAILIQRNNWVNPTRTRVPGGIHMIWWSTIHHCEHLIEGEISSDFILHPPGPMVFFLQKIGEKLRNCYLIYRTLLNEKKKTCKYRFGHPIPQCLYCFKDQGAPRSRWAFKQPWSWSSEKFKKVFSATTILVPHLDNKKNLDMNEEWGLVLSKTFKKTSDWRFRNPDKHMNKKL